MATVIGCPKIEIPPFDGFAEGLTVEAEDCPPDVLECEVAPHATLSVITTRLAPTEAHHGRLLIDHRLPE
jgi:hypothetical protein